MKGFLKRMTVKWWCFRSGAADSSSLHKLYFLLDWGTGLAQWLLRTTILSGEFPALSPSLGSNLGCCPVLYLFFQQNLHCCRCIWCQQTSRVFSVRMTSRGLNVWDLLGFFCPPSASPNPYIFTHVTLKNQASCRPLLENCIPKLKGCISATT